MTYLPVSIIPANCKRSIAVSRSHHRGGLLPDWTNPPVISDRHAPTSDLATLASTRTLIIGFIRLREIKHQRQIEARRNCEAAKGCQAIADPLSGATSRLESRAFIYLLLLATLHIDEALAKTTVCWC